MLKNTFLKTLFEKRWVLLGWAGALFVLNAALIQLFPAIRDAFSGMTADLPDSMKVWFGDGEIWNTVEGYISQEVFGQMAAVIVVFSIIFGGSILAGEEKSGVLLSQMAQPLKRGSYFWQKFAALATGLFAVVAFYIAGTWLGTVILGDIVNFGDLLLPALAVYLLGMAFGGLTIGIGAATGRGGLSSTVVGFYALVFYFIVSMRAMAPLLENLSKASPFYWYDGQNVMSDGLGWLNIVMMICFALIPAIIGVIVFRKRDLKTR